MKCDVLWCATLVLWLGAASIGVRVLAQDRPDFSGSWVLESTTAGADTPRSLSVRQVLVRTNVRGEPMPPFYKDIEITRALVDGSSSRTYQIGVVGGTVFGRPGGIEGPRTWHRVVWEGQALVFEHGRHTGTTPESGDWADRREAWSFDSEGRIHVTIVTRGAATHSTTVESVYRRQ